jgi:hypothetical protein
MWDKIINWAVVFFTTISIQAQTFTYSGYIRNADGTGAVNVPVKLYKRTTPVMNGFTSQNNYNGHSYYRSTGSAFWLTAKSNCEAMGGHLVTVTTAAENNFIFNLWPSGWIGLADEAQEGVWRWVTNESYSYTSWNGGEPNNAGNEDYVQFVGGGKWNDLPNSVSLPYVIEFDYVVTYTSWVLFRTVYTNSAGYWNVSETTNPSVEWYIQMDPVTPVTQLTTTDMVEVSKLVLGITPIKSIHYYRYDVNGDGRINVADENYINLKRYNFLSNWVNTSPSRYYITAQYATLTTNTSDLRITIPGVNSITINSPVSGETINYYLIAPAYKSTVNY